MLAVISYKNQKTHAIYTWYTHNVGLAVWSWEQDVVVSLIT